MISTIIILAFLGGIFYYLAYISPKTDAFLYFFAGLLFLFAGIAGYFNIGDVQTGEFITYTYITYNSSVVVDTETHNNVYTGNNFYSKYLPSAFVLLAMYIWLAMTSEVLGSNDGSRRNKRENI